MNYTVLTIFNTTVYLIAFALVTLLFVILIVAGNKRCPAGKVLIVYNNKKTKTKVIRQGSIFVIPGFQKYEYLDLSPIPIDINLKNILTIDDKTINISTKISVAISTDPLILYNAATHLAGLTIDKIKQLITEIIELQLKLVAVSMTTKEIMSGKEKFNNLARKQINDEIKKIGLQLSDFQLFNLNNKNTLEQRF